MNQPSMAQQETHTIEPQRYIYSDSDLAHFKNSSAKRDLLGFVSSLGRSCATTTLEPPFDPNRPLLGLSPGMATLHGALTCMADTWVRDIPPASRERARFGNQAFRLWHQRLEQRSFTIIKAILDSHLTYLAGIQQQQQANTSKSSSFSVTFDYHILQECSNLGIQAAAAAATSATETLSETVEPHSLKVTSQDAIIHELQAHLHLSFGQPIRLDFGTGHESCFYIFLLCLFKLGIFGYMDPNLNPSPNSMAPVALSITTQYLRVCRGLQADQGYMLEPAGSHGVWGIDDYHCIPFYIGACQLQQAIKYCSLESMQQHLLGELIKPSIIHRDDVLQSDLASIFIYLGCIKFVKSLKKVAFFESSPVLNDISHCPDWVKVSSGLLRLYEGDVLDRISVVQHFVFGDLFKGTCIVCPWDDDSNESFIHVVYNKLYSVDSYHYKYPLATWTPSEKPRPAPTQTFIHHAGGVEECVAPLAKTHKNH